MRSSCALIALMALVMVSAPATAGDLTPDEHAFFDKHVSDVVRLVPNKLDDPAVTNVFSTAFFHVKVLIKDQDGEESQDLILVRVGDKLVNTSSASTDADLPSLVKMFNASFKLKSDDDARKLQRALDTVYPIISDNDKKVEAIIHSGNQWTLVRGNFITSKMGYVFTTDANGSISAAKYVMKLP